MGRNPAYEVQPFNTFREILAHRAVEFEKLVLLLHGDTHKFRFDKPLNMTDGGDRVENVYRLEVFGAPTMGWIEVGIDPNSASVFSVTPITVF